MVKQLFYRKIGLILLLSTLCALFSFVPSQAQAENSQQTANEKIEQLAKAVNDLESTVKSLSQELQKSMTFSRIDDMWYPRILAAEALSKDLITDLKQTNLRLSQIESSQKRLTKLPLDLKTSVSSLSARTKTNEQTLSQLQETVSKLGQSQNQTVTLQGTVSLLDQRLAQLENSLNNNSLFKTQADQFYKALQEQSDKRFNTFQTGMKTSFKSLQEQTEKTYKNIQTQVRSYQDDLTTRLNTIDSQIKSLQDSFATLALRQEKVDGTFLEVRTFISEVGTRTEQAESRTSKLQDVVTQMSGLQPVVASLQDQINKIATKLEEQVVSGQSTSVLQSQYNTVQTQVADMRERLAALQNKLETLSNATTQNSIPEKRFERLQEAIGQVLIETQANKIQLLALETRVDTLTGSTGTQTTLSEDVEQRLKQAEQTAKDAKAAVELANTISLIALLSGIAGIIVGLIL